MSDVINKLILVHEKGYGDFDGPFSFSTDGWTWNVEFPLDSDEYASLSTGEEYTLRHAEGHKAVAIKDNEVCAFGTIKSVDEFEGEDGIHMAVETPGKP